MKSLDYHFLSNQFIELAKQGLQSGIDEIMAALDNADLPITRIVDFALSHVDNPEGIDTLGFYLLHGSLIQRNYSALYFARRNEWQRINEAFALGRIDRIQAYSR